MDAPCRVLVVGAQPVVYEAFCRVLLPGEAGSAIPPGASTARKAPHFTTPTPPEREGWVLRCVGGVDDARRIARRANEAEAPYAIVFLCQDEVPHVEGAELVEEFWAQDARTQVVLCAEHRDASLDALVQRLEVNGNLALLPLPFAAMELRLLTDMLRAKWRLEATFAARLEAIQAANRRLAAELERRKQIESHLRSLAHVDSLTALPNRRRLLEQLDARLATRHNRACGNDALLFLDVDDFKQVNDQLGHEAGDQLLLQIAQRLRQCTRQSDLVGMLGSADTARLGGDEFVILLCDLRSPRDALRIAERIRGVLSQPFELDARTLSNGVSIGVALLDAQISNAAAWLRHADTAMYRAKLRGKGRVALLAPPRRT